MKELHDYLSRICILLYNKQFTYYSMPVKYFFAWTCTIIIIAITYLGGYYKSSILPYFLRHVYFLAHQFPKLFFFIEAIKSTLPYFISTNYTETTDQCIYVYITPNVLCCEHCSIISLFISIERNILRKHWIASWMVVFLSSSHRWYIHHYVFP